MIPNLFGRPFAEGLYWSLQVEVVFYFTCALLILKFDLRKISVAWIFLPVLMCQGIFQRLSASFGAFELAAFCMRGLAFILVGWLIRKFFDKEKMSWPDRILFGVVLVYYLIVMPIRAWKEGSAGNEWAPWIIKSNAIILFFLFLYLIPPVATLSHLGRISYSIYLIHPIVMYSIYKLAGYPIGKIFAESDPILSLTVILSLTILLSHFSWLWIEQTFQRVGVKALRSGLA